MRLIIAVVTTGALLTAGCASHATAPAATPAASPTIGKFVWHDLSTDDLPAAQRFYGGLLGWQFQSATRQNRPYVIAFYKGQMIGGLVAVNPAAGQEVSRWVPYISVASVDGAATAVQTAGGRTLIAPVDVGTAGRAAVVTDPQGAVFGLAKLTHGDPPDSTPVEGTFFWMEYFARDPAAAVSFYTRTFGYQQQPVAGISATDYAVLSLGRPRGGVLQAPRADMDPIWLPSILVSDPVALAARAASLGGTVLLEPRQDIRRGSLAVVADPSGAIVALQKYPF